MGVFSKTSLIRPITLKQIFVLILKVVIEPKLAVLVEPPLLKQASLIKVVLNFI